MVWLIILGLLVVFPGVAAVIYACVKEPSIRWGVIVSLSLIGGPTMIIYGVYG